MSESLDDFKRQVAASAERTRRRLLGPRLGLLPSNGGFVPPVRDQEPEMSLEERKDLYAAMRRAGPVSDWYSSWFRRTFLER